MKEKNIVKKIYIVLEDYAVDFERGTNINLFSTYKKARKYFKDTINDYKKDDMLYNTIEEEKDCFSTYDDGCYIQYHNNLQIIEKEVL